MANRKWVRTQDAHRIELARRHSKRMFDLRDLNLVGGKVAYEEILSCVPEQYHFQYTTFTGQILPLMQKMGHALVVKRVKRSLIADSVRLETPRHNAWIVQVDALPVWALYVVARYRRIEHGVWTATHPWSTDDFIDLAYRANADELEGVLDVEQPETRSIRLNKRKRPSKDGRSHKAKGDTDGQQVQVEEET